MIISLQYIIKIKWETLVDATKDQILPKMNNNLITQKFMLTILMKSQNKPILMVNHKINGKILRRVKHPSFMEDDNLPL